MSNGRPATSFTSPLSPLALTPSASPSSSISRNHILVVDDDTGFRELLVTQLEILGHEVTTAASGSAALHRLRADTPQLVLLDLGLPDIDGVSLCRTIIQHWRIPIIVISCYTDEVRKVALLDAGASDYVTKPVPLAELQARIRVALRTMPLIAVAHPPVLQIGDLSIDCEHRLVQCSGQRLTLSPLEWRLLIELTRRPNEICTYHMLLSAIWPEDPLCALTTLHTLVSQLRRRLVQAGVIENVRGMGYLLNAEA